MAQIINDFEAMRRFRNDLEDTVDTLEETLRRTEDALEKISRTWQDEQHMKYARGFEEDKQLIQPLCRTIKDLSDGPLYDLEQIIKEYTQL